MSTLGLDRVVRDISNGAATPAFQAYKLTHLLRDSLGSNCAKGLMACARSEAAAWHNTHITCEYDVTSVLQCETRCSAPPARVCVYDMVTTALRSATLCPAAMQTSTCRAGLHNR